MITKTNDIYSFNINGESGSLDREYNLSYQDKVIKFSNLKTLHLFVNTLTDIVEDIDLGVKNA